MPSEESGPGGGDSGCGDSSSHPGNSVPRTTTSAHHRIVTHLGSPANSLDACEYPWCGRPAGVVPAEPLVLILVVVEIENDAGIRCKAASHADCNRAEAK